MFALRSHVAAALLAACVATPLVAQSTTATPPRQRVAQAGSPQAQRQMTTADLEGWKSIRSATLSADGKWFAYILMPNEGDASVVVRGTAAGSRELRFPVGELSGSGSLQISGDSRWLAFSVSPTVAEGKKLKKARKPVHTSVALVNLASGEKTQFANIRRFDFNGDAPSALAMQGYVAEAAPGGSSSRSQAADLLLYDLASGTVITTGNVGEFAFDESGRYMAYTVEAREKVGNGVQLRDMESDVVRALDSDSAIYRRLTWADSGLALAVLRGHPDSASKDTLYAVVAFTGFGARGPVERTFDAAGRKDFPAGMKVSPDRAPSFSEDFSAVYFGIREMNNAPTASETVAEAKTSSVVQAGAPGAGGTINQPRGGSDDEEPSIVIWNSKDSRLQSQQLVQEQQDKRYSFLSEYRFGENRFVRLADDELRSVSPMAHDIYALGLDSRAYDHDASFTGRQYRDVYGVDLKTGTRKLLLEKHHALTIPSPDGKQILYWGKDGNYYVADVASGQSRNITKGVSTSFVDTEDDHNNLYPPAINPRQANLGWTSDGSAVLLSDNWDIWKVPVKSGEAVNLTVDGKRTQVRYQRRYSFIQDEKGIDVSRPMYVGTYGEWTKKEGISRVDARRGGAKSLMWDDAAFNFVKAEDADVYAYTRQTFTEFPDWHVTGSDFRADERLTEANPQQKEFPWSPGSRLVDYTSDKGDKLQAALFLPANYEPGKKYPTVVYIYEKLSQGLHQYATPNDTRALNPSVYTSRGYAVLMPDIVYTLNDPGMSAVWCVLPAVKAAAATGIVDINEVGLHGHSWGGYQTAFLVTQTNMFKAAIAGAPLTDMVSMYSSVYWNSGGTNQAIFESSQGRFKGNFIENYDAYIRNSPAFHADNVTTPLIILHNDKDGAVDFNQGITYYNTLRQLGKDVVLLEYMGENHGLRKPVNQKDYAIRMREFFDHHLRGAPAPEWLEKGIPRIEMDEHLRERREMEKPQGKAIVP